MANKIRDLAVKTGEYTNRNGETKGRWQNVGSLMQGDDGGMFLILDRTFNPAGVPNPENRSNVMVSCFEPKQHDGNQQQRPRDNYQAPPGASDIDDTDIPF